MTSFSSSSCFHPRPPSLLPSYVPYSVWYVSRVIFTCILVQFSSKGNEITRADQHPRTPVDFTYKLRFHYLPEKENQSNDVNTMNHSRKSCVRTIRRGTVVPRRELLCVFPFCSQLAAAGELLVPAPILLLVQSFSLSHCC